MARLRIRIELSRGGLGVPLHKVASVISKAQKFMDLLGEDVHIDVSKGEWLGFDFDRDSLNFTAEYIGAVTPEQAEAFNAAFDGTTSLRRETIAQFAGIADAIGEDEIIGFGLYENDDTAEPTEWRCLSRRDALRIAEGIQMLLGENQGSHLPAARDPDLGARIFGDRREWAGEHGTWPDSMREVERSLSSRIQRVENRVEQHSELIQNLRAHSASTETSFRNLLSSVESFCDQATRRIEMASPAALPRWPAEPAPKQSHRWETGGAAIALSLAVIAGIAWLWPAHPAANTKKDPVVVSAVSASLPETHASPVAASSAPAASAPSLSAPASTEHNAKASTRIDLEATEPSWISLTDVDGKRVTAQLLVPGSPRTFELAKGGTLRTGNAGGLLLRVNGQPMGSLGPTGQIRQIQIRDGRVVNAVE